MGLVCTPQMDRKPLWERQSSLAKCAQDNFERGPIRQKRIIISNPYRRPLLCAARHGIVSHHLIQPAIPTNERNEMVFTRMQDDEQGQGEGPHSNTWTLDLGRRYVGCYHMDVLRDLVILLSTNEYG